MSAPIPVTDLEIVVRLIREIGQLMYGMGEMTNAPRRHLPVSRSELSGSPPPLLTYDAAWISEDHHIHIPPVALFVAVASCNSGHTICFWSAHVTGPSDVKSSSPGQGRPITQAPATHQKHTG